MNNLGIDYDDGDINIETDDIGVAEAIEDYLRAKGRALVIETVGWLSIIVAALTGSVFFVVMIIKFFVK